ncbi:MAG: HD domain-containing protein [Pirellulales bacterium]|nr:HD domain-containing protein [Pirellulales bacterium]
MSHQVLSNERLATANATVPSRAAATGGTNAGGAMGKLAVEMLRPPAELNFSLYLFKEGDAQPRLYRDAKYPITEADVDRLKESGTEYLYVVSNEVHEYCEYLKETVVSDTSVEPTLRYEALRQATRTAFSKAAGDKKINEAVEVTEYIGQNTVDLICGDEVLLAELFDVMTHDYDTFNHAVNVSTYCVLIANELGVRERSTLVEIAQGALLHDLGKQFLPRWLLNQTDPLSQAQQETVMRHPHRGFEELCHRDDLSWGQLMMVYQHHERCDGSGYPVGNTEREIHEWGRLCAVADVFDAMSRSRPYRRAIDDADVLAYLDRQAGRAFDEEMVQCLIRIAKAR